MQMTLNVDPLFFFIPFVESSWHRRRILVLMNQNLIARNLRFHEIKTEDAQLSSLCRTFDGLSTPQPEMPIIIPINTFNYPCPRKLHKITTRPPQCRFRQLESLAQIIKPHIKLQRLHMHTNRNTPHTHHSQPHEIHHHNTNTKLLRFGLSKPVQGFHHWKVAVFFEVLLILVMSISGLHVESYHLENEATP